mmetsp:Transcript_48772/g.135321  ORF Transcript_48772/g.135321 Transcript_48772/m.135321 type:complete len:353 (-) Transcript_48772:899-1957(-)
MTLTQLIHTAAAAAPTAQRPSLHTRASLGVKPGERGLRVDGEVDEQRRQRGVKGLLHARDRLRLGLCGVLRGPLEDHLVVDLQQHAVAQLLEPFRASQLEHRQRHDVGGAALDRRVDGRALQVATHRRRAVDAIELTVAAHQRARPAVRVRVGDRLLLPLPHLGPVRVPRLEHRLGLGDGDAPILREAVRRLAVGNREVERLGAPPLRAEEVLEQRRRRLALGVVPLKQAVAALDRRAHVVKHPHRGARVEAAARGKGIDHRLARRDVCKQAQLELAVVRHHEHVALLRREGLPDLVLILLERRLVLQVGRARREAACLGVEVERAMDARVGVNILLQRKDEVGQHRLDRAH